jgi:surface polysaccharide O-acyltransferase-like enzyme
MAERRYDMDWLRALAMLVVFFFHSGRFFDEGWWHIKNDELSLGMSIFAGIVGQWMMPLFFMISGAASWFSLSSRAGGRYALERLKRLFIPCLFGMLVIVPPQIYLERVQNSQFHGSYLQFYPRSFDGPYPDGNCSWHHLWFLMYLFVFSLIALPLFLRLRRAAGRGFVSRLAVFCQKPGRIFLLALPIVIIEIALRPKFPGFQNLVADWANFLTYLTLFIYGYIFLADARLAQAVRRHGPVALALGIATLLLVAALALSGREPAGGYTLGFALWEILDEFNTWFFLIAILWLAQRFLSFSSGSLQYANEAVLPFYVLHQTVIIIIGFHVIKWPLGVMPKYLIISTLSFLATVALYEFAVRRTNPTRFLFGMRLKTRTG